MSSSPSFEYDAVKGLDYFLHEQPHIPGTTQKGSKVPLIFKPLKIKNTTLTNRLGVSPMCMYSANDKFEVNPFHLVHYGGIAQRGPGITFVEATSVSENGGLSPRDLAIFNDNQAKELKKIVDYVHGFKKVIGLQLAHGGRKSSAQPLFVHLEQKADKSIGGWPDNVVAPSPIPFRPNGNLPTPKELTIDQIKKIVKQWGEAAHRAVSIAGFDVLEIHAAHGYLLNEFLSPISNHRSDEYGGSFENRTRFLLEVIDEVVSAAGPDIPIFLRISAVENTPTPNAWTIEDSIKLVEIVSQRGVDVIDVSSGGNDHKQLPRTGQKHEFPIHVPHARKIKEALGDKILVATVGSLDEDPIATNDYIEKGYFDIALVGKAFLKNPGLVNKFADDLGVDLHSIAQYEWGYYPDKAGIIELIKRAEELTIKEEKEKSHI